MSKIDLHTHSFFSDGSDSPLELIENIKKNNIEIFSLTDHDTIKGYNEIYNYLPNDVKLIKGIEFTCNASDFECHILGYNIDLKNKDINNLIDKGKILRRKKLDIRIEFLKEKWGIILTESEKKWLYSRNSVVKTHLANVIVNRGLEDDVVVAIKKYLTGCEVPSARFDAKDAIKAIKNASGIPVWAHPIGGEGSNHISWDLFRKRLKIMKAYGIEGLECYYSRYNEEEIKILKNMANDNNMLISGGSDYHGANKTVLIAQLNTQNRPIDSKDLTITNKFS